MSSTWSKEVGVAMLIALVFGAPVVAADENGKVDPNLASYTPVENVTGTIKSIGSDTMNNLMKLWCEGFCKFYPNVQKEIQGPGSGAAPTALIQGTAQFGPMSREMKASEIDKFEKKFGYKPTRLATCIDMLAVYVHKDNPLRGLSLQQVDGIFSKNRKGGRTEEIRTWGDLGLTGEWSKKPISLYGRNSSSGTYGFFKEFALFNGDFKDSVKEQAGSSAVVQAVANDKFAIGYSGIGYMTSGVRAVPLAVEDGADMIPADEPYGYDGSYPLTRFLYVYLNYQPGESIDPLRREFVRYIFSREGQLDVRKDHYLPVVADQAAEALTSLGIEASP